MAYGGGVLIEMGINSARMAADMGKITSIMQSGARKIESAFRNIGATVVGAIGVGSLGAMSSAAIQTAHDVELMSQKFGIAAGTLSEYLVTAKVAGVDIEGVGKGLKFLAKNATDAATGVGKNAEIFKKMGINVLDATGKMKPMADLLEEIRGKFQGYTQGTEMAALALKLFGREGVSMIPWLVMSKEQLEEMERVGKAFGATMTDDGIKVVAELADNFHLLEFAGKGLANQFVSGIAPMLNQIIGDLVTWAIETEAVTKVSNILIKTLEVFLVTGTTLVMVFRHIGASLAGFAAAGVAFFTGRMDLIPGIWRDTLAQMESDTEKFDVTMAGIVGNQTPPGHPSSHTPVGGKKKTPPRFTDDDAAAKELQKALRKIGEEALKSQEHLDSLFMKSDEAATAFARKGLLGVELELTKLDDELTKFMGIQLEAWEAGALTTAEYTKKMEMATAATVKLKDEVIRLNQAQIDANVNAQAHADWSESMGAEYGDAFKAIDQTVLSLRDYNDAVSIAIGAGNLDLALRLLNDDLAVQNQKVKDAADAVNVWQAAWDYANTTTQGYMNQIGEVTLRAFSGMEDAITNFVMTGKKNFTDFANSVIADLMRIAVRASITAPLAGMFGSIFSGFGGGSTGTTSISGSGFTGKIGGPTTFPGMALGGPVSGGSSYLVGERGPELFVPSSSGSIVPGGGGGNVTVNIKNESGQPVKARASSSFDLSGTVIDIVLDGLNRNVHGLRTALGGA